MKLTLKQRFKTNRFMRKLLREAKMDRKVCMQYGIDTRHIVTLQQLQLKWLEAEMKLYINTLIMEERFPDRVS